MTIKKANHKVESMVANFTMHRMEKLNGIDYMVAPVIAIVEGVHSGSGGAAFYPADELIKSEKLWNGKPLTIHHPTGDNGEPVNAFSPIGQEITVGNFWNVKYEGGKLKGEIWIDIKRCMEIAPEILEIIKQNNRLEVSTGLIADSDGIQGVWKGEQYLETLSNIIPDHLALLPGAEGACGWIDGCGVRLNKKNGGEKNEMNEYGTIKINDLSFEDRREQIQSIVEKMNNNMPDGSTFNYVKAVYDDYYVFEQMKEGVGSALFKQEYKVKKDNTIELKGDLEQVRQEIKFIKMNIKQKEHNMKRIEKVKAIIANAKLPQFVEADTESLEKMEEGLFNKVYNTHTELLECACREEEAKNKIANSKKEDEKKVENKIEEKKEEVKKVMTAEEYINAAPEGVREFLVQNKQEFDRKKNSLIKEILAIKTNKFSEESLQKKDINDLENMVALAGIDISPVVNYSGRKVSNGNDEKVYARNERHLDGSGVPDAPNLVEIMMANGASK